MSIVPARPPKHPMAHLLRADVDTHIIHAATAAVSWSEVAPGSIGHAVYGVLAAVMSAVVAAEDTPEVKTALDEAKRVIEKALGYPEQREGKYVKYGKRPTFFRDDVERCLEVRMKPEIIARHLKSLRNYWGAKAMFPHVSDETEVEWVRAIKNLTKLHGFDDLRKLATAVIVECAGLADHKRPSSLFKAEANKSARAKQRKEILQKKRHA